MASTMFLAKLLGSFFLVVGIALFSKKDALLKEFVPFAENTVAMFYAGALAFLAGISMVLHHNSWENGMESLISLFGWIALIKGASLMILPNNIFVDLVKSFNKPVYYHLKAMALILLGAYFAFYGFGWM